MFPEPDLIFEHLYPLRRRVTKLGDGGEVIAPSYQLIKVEDSIYKIVSILNERGHRALIIGGAVRDALLGIAPKDIDIEVYKISYEELEKILSEYGSVDLVGQTFGVILFKPAGSDMTYDFSIPRKENKVGIGHKGFKIFFDKDMTIKEAGARRDFTWNALAYDPLENKIYDYFGGVKDLEDKIIRHTSDAFSEDALRVLRCMQFQARFDFAIHPDTIAEMRKMVASEDFDDLPRERLFGEWNKWAIKGVRHDLIFKFMRDTGLIEKYPELKALAETPQDHIYHPEGNVEIHTAMTLHEMDKIIERENIIGEEKLLLVMSILLHDIGKPATTKEEMKRGRMTITSNGHESLGGTMSRDILAKMGFHEELITPVDNIVSNHLAGVSISMITAESGKLKAVKKLSRRLYPATIKQLMYVIEADSRGRGGEQKEPTGMSDLAELSLKADIQNKPYEAILKGRDLIEIGLKPSPKFGEIIRASFEAQESGEFGDIDGAKKWLADNMSSFIMAGGGKTDDFWDSEKRSNFVVTKTQIQDVISGKSEVRNGATIQSIASYLRGSTGASSQIKGSKLYKKEEAEHLRAYATENNLWFPVEDLKNYIDEGAEQKVYFIDDKNVIKINDSIFYNSWEDYFTSLLLHNYFFPDTAYELIGFMEDNNILFAVVKQPFVKETEKTDLGLVKKFMAENGFANTKDNDYYNSELGLILEDLHDENVLTKDGVLRFVDTVFYMSDSPKMRMAKGGEAGDGSKPTTPVIDADVEGRGGLVVGDSHADGGVPYVLEDSGTHIEEEGEEANLPNEIKDITEVYTFKGKNHEVIHKILQLVGLKLSNKVTSVRSGDLVICKASLWDDTVRTYTGTPIQIVSAVNESEGCNHIESGATMIENGKKVEMEKGGNVGYDDAIRMLYGFGNPVMANGGEVNTAIDKMIALGLSKNNQSMVKTAKFIGDFDLENDMLIKARYDDLKYWVKEAIPLKDMDSMKGDWRDKVGSNNRDEFLYEVYYSQSDVVGRLPKFAEKIETAITKNKIKDPDVLAWAKNYLKRLKEFMPIAIKFEAMKSRIGKKEISKEAKENKERQDAYAKIYAFMPSANKEILSELVKDITKSFKPFEDEIYERMDERYRKLIQSYVGKKDPIKADVISRDIKFYDEIYDIEKTYQRDEKVMKKYRGSTSGAYESWERYTYLQGLSKKDGWEKVLDSKLKSTIEGFRVELLLTIMEKFEKITEPIAKYKLLDIKSGYAGFEGSFEFKFKNGSSFIFETQAIVAGGYNIQIEHLRYISHFKNATLSDGKKLSDPHLTKVVENFSVQEPKKEKGKLLKSSYVIGDVAGDHTKIDVVPYINKLAQKDENRFFISASFIKNGVTSSAKISDRLITSYDEYISDMVNRGGAKKMEKGGEVPRIKESIEYLNHAPHARMELYFDDESKKYPQKGKPNSLVSSTSRGTLTGKRKWEAHDVVAYDNKGKIVGVLSVLTKSEADEESVGAFKIVVRDDARIKGWATKLLDRAEEDGIDMIEAVRHNNYSSRGRWMIRLWLEKKLSNKKEKGGMAGEDISGIVKSITQEYESRGVACDLINEGECMNFAEELYSELSSRGIKAEILSDAYFYDASGDTPLEELASPDEYGKTPDDFDAIGLPSHYWVYVGGKHYDSDAPDGAEDMFELPTIKNFYLKHSKLMANGGDTATMSVKELLKHLYKEHHDTFAIAKDLEETTPLTGEMNAERVIEMWDKELDDHFKEEEEIIFPRLISMNITLTPDVEYLIVTHNKFRDDIMPKVRADRNRASVIRFASALKEHILDEEKLFRSIMPDPYREITPEDMEKGGSAGVKKKSTSLLAPNGKPSNLTAEQYKLVRTPAFKKWFGDWEKSPRTSSRVIDSNGEPKEMFYFEGNKINLRKSVEINYENIVKVLFEKQIIS